MALGDGRTALFWEDRWLGGQGVRELAPMLFQCIPKQRRKTRTVAEAMTNNRWARDIQGLFGLPEIGQYLKLWHLVQYVELSNEPDKLLWSWTTNGTYTAQSCYRATFQGAMDCHSWKLIWRTWAPPRVKFFIGWLAKIAAGPSSGSCAAACSTTRDNLMMYVNVFNYG
nr:uncharacterized protein LOC109767190 [Aegilops tauschii subsp. strangulata]